MISVADTAMRAVEYALRGLEMRSNVRANNVANANTPMFRAGRVDFERSLQAALRSGRPEAAPEPVITADPNFPNGQGNTVSLENELIGLMKDNMLRDAMVNSYNFKANVLRTAIQGR